MLNRVQMSAIGTQKYSGIQKAAPKVQNNATNAVQFTGKSGSADKLAAAYRGYNGIQLASTVSFTANKGLNESFADFNETMVTCQDIEAGRKGEAVGSRADVSALLKKFEGRLPKYDDAVKTTLQLEKGKNADGEDTVTDARTQVKKGEDNNYIFNMVVRTPRKADELPGRTGSTQQSINFELDPDVTPERVYVLNTKGKQMAVVEDGDDVILTKAGTFAKSDISTGKLEVIAKQAQDVKGNLKPVAPQNTFTPFKITNVPVVTEKTGGSQGGGTEIVIGLENGRFVPEIIDSIKTFCEKVDNGEIVLDEFVPAKDADKTQVAMLAGGFGSRAEYTNASSSRIFHGEENGSNLTKGCFRTATGLTPMETTFISLHKAGLLDCSKGSLGIGKNVKFYLNDSGINGGNGGFTIDMYDTMAREDRDTLLILPNDAMSRIPNALKEMNDIMASGKAAVVMVAKEVDKEDARGSLGIMKIDDEGKIDAFAEKPKVFEDGYVDENDKCFANTFQFTVSKEAFEALDILEEYLPANDSGKEPRDWSKTLTPILMALTQNDNPKDAQEAIQKVTKQKMPLGAVIKAKNALGNQKIYAVKTAEPWADCGNLNALYYTTMQIASGDFPLEDFERKHVIDSINSQTGLVASTPEQKERIESKYDINGQVMVVPQAEAVSEDIVDDYADAITRYSDVK